MSDKKEKVELISKEIEEDKKNNLRPKNIDGFIGQDNLISNLKTYIESSEKRKKNLDHIILDPVILNPICLNPIIWMGG